MKYVVELEDELVGPFPTHDAVLEWVRERGAGRDVRIRPLREPWAQARN